MGGEKEGGAKMKNPLEGLSISQTSNFPLPTFALPREYKEKGRSPEKGRSVPFA